LAAQRRQPSGLACHCRARAGDKDALAALAEPAAKRYVAQQQAGESPWNAVDPTKVSQEAMPPRNRPGACSSLSAGNVVLVVCVDLRVIASTDQFLERVG
jgi:hypothetical protein